MGKFVYAIMLVFFIEFALYFFAGADYAQTSLFGFILNPSDSSVFYVLLYAAIFALGTVGIVATAFFQINIYGVYAGMAAVLLTFFMSIVHLVGFLDSSLASKISPEFSLFIISLISAPLIIFYLIATIEWVRSN